MRAAVLSLAAVAVLGSTGTAARAQYGAFDMGALTNTLSQDAARRQAQKRAGGAQAGDAGTLEARKARARASCTRARQAAEDGNRHAQLQQLLNLCARAGY